MIITVPKWVAIVGGLEALFGLWGFYAIATMLTACVPLNTAAIAGTLAACIVAIGSLIAGTQVARGHTRAVEPLMWILAVQSVRIAIPGFLWLVSCGWT